MLSARSAHAATIPADSWGLATTAWAVERQRSVGVTECIPHSSPVYRRFLAGEPEVLRLSWSASAVVVGSGLIVLGIAGGVSALGGAADPAARWPSVAVAALTAWLVAAIAARWLGSRLGALAGLVQLTGMYAPLPTEASATEMLFCTAVSAAMGAFALGNVPGRLPLVERCWTSWAFYAAAGVSFVLAGPLGPALIMAGCLLFLVLSADSRGARFFASGVGIAVFGLTVVVSLVLPGGVNGHSVVPGGMVGGHSGPPISPWEALGWLAVAGLPWTPLVVWTVALGLRQGHYATPIWRFLGCWALGPLALAALGGFREPWQLGALLPPLAVMGAAGLWGLLVWCRRRWRWPEGRRTGDR